MPQGVYTGMTCATFSNARFEPLPHQKFVIKYFLASPYKGILLYHKLGSGKTCTAIMTADLMLKYKIINHVFLLTPGSLRSGWVEEYCQKCGIDQKNMKEKFTFITYNFDTSRELAKISFDNTLVIIDEVHVFINGVKNDSRIYTALYEKIIMSKCRVMALSGTPTTDDMYQLALLCNMLRKNTFDEIVQKGRQAFSIEQELDLNVIPKNSLRGIISYFAGDSKSFPRVYYHDPIRVQMSEQQMKEYVAAVTKEKNSNRPSPALAARDRAEFNKRLAQYMMAVQHIPTRAASNFCYDNEDKKIDKKTKEIVVLPDKTKTNGGWLDSKTFRNKMLLEKYSPKFAAIFINIIMNYHTKHMIYTFFVHKSGIDLFETVLNQCGITTATFYGDMSDKNRANILKKFNSVENRNGDIIRVLLVSEAGNAGITLLETNNIHIVESSNNEIKTSQAIGRVARFKSHINMPIERQYVNVWRYWSIPIGANTSEDGDKGIDEILYRRGVEKEKIAAKITDLLVQNSIESGTDFL